MAPDEGPSPSSPTLHLPSDAVIPSAQDTYPSEPLLRRLILSYLLRNCYAETALAYTPANHPDSLTASQLSEIKQRKDMMERVRKGDIAQGIEIAEKCSGCKLVEMDEELWFDCLLQRFVESLRRESLKESIRLFQEEIAKCAKGDRGRLNKLMEYGQLFCHAAPEKSPVGNLMGWEKREELAERLNNTVVKQIRGGERGGGMKAELEMLIRQALVVKEVEKAGGVLNRKSKLTVEELLRKEKEKEEETKDEE